MFWRKKNKNDFQLYEEELDQIRNLIENKDEDDEDSDYGDSILDLEGDEPEDLDESAVIQYWDEESHSEDPSFYCQDRLGKGYRWIYSFAPDFYFDYSPCLCPMRKTAGVTNRLRS